MKKRILFCLTTLLCYATAQAYDFKVDGIYYNLVDALSVEVTFDDTDTGIHGATDYNYDSYTGDVEVPAMVSYEGGLYDVVGIGASAFRAYSTTSSTLTSVSLPESITYFNDNAFDYDFALTSLNIPAAVTKIGQYAFRNCTGLTMEFPISSIITSIGDRAFYNCMVTTFNVAEDNEYFTSIDGVLFNKDATELIQYPCGKESTTYEMPSSTTTLAAYALAYATNLEEVVLSDNITSLANGYTFYECEKLTSITLSQGITQIGAYTFAYCYSLPTIVLPEVVTTIGNYAFYHCESLTEIALPDGLTSLGNRTLANCTALEYVDFPEGVTEIPQYVCYQCYGLKEVTMGSQTTTIDSYAIYECPSLEEITIPESVTSIGVWGIGCQYEDTSTKIYCMPTTPPTLGASGILVTPHRSALYVPAGTMNTYSRASTLYNNFTQWNTMYEYEAQTVETTEAADITYKSATINGNVNVGSQKIKEYGFDFWAGEYDEENVQTIVTESLTASLTGLEDDTEYTYRAYAKNPASGKVYGNEMTFTTDKFYAPTVTTYEASEVTYCSALVKGYVAAGSDSLIGQGIEYWAGEYSEENVQTIVSEDEVMAFVLTDLSPETTYTYRTYAIADTEIVYYSDNLTFTTEEDTTTGISSIDNDTNGEKVVYNLQGIRVADMSQKGVYIVDGKKVLVK